MDAIEGSALVIDGAVCGRALVVTLTAQGVSCVAVDDLGDAERLVPVPVAVVRPSAFAAQRERLAELIASQPDMHVVLSEQPTPHGRPRPLSLGEVVAAVRAALAGAASADPADDPAFAGIVTVDPALRALLRYVRAAAITREPILITGETGTGKELVARAVHHLSGAIGEHVAVNVAGLDDVMFADTLFGHRKGAFTGADDIRAGLILCASGGTLFLDEIGELSVASQVKLLRLLQEKEYFPLGRDRPKRTSARVVVATSCDLEAMRRDRRFRDDLYFRLRTHHVHLPPLRERLGDIPLLCRHFARRAAIELSRPVPEVGADLLALIATHPFPGNVRELQGLIFDAVSSGEQGKLDLGPVRRAVERGAGEAAPERHPGGLPTSVERMAFPLALPTLAEMDEALMVEALRRAQGNQARAAAMLGISRQALHKRLRKRSEVAAERFRA